jgi:membrane protein YdbS with pleckstrin-like domain
MDRISHEQIVWASYPAWSHFSWLYLFTAFTALRGALLVKFGLPGSEVWFGGAVLLLICVALLRRWAFYVMTRTKVVVRNGYTGHDMDSVEHQDIKSFSIHQGPIARFLGIGTLVIHTADDDRVIRFRGIKDPEIVKTKLEALRPVQAGSA